MSDPVATGESVFPVFLSKHELTLLDDVPVHGPGDRVCISDAFPHPVLLRDALRRRIARLTELKAPGVIIEREEAALAAVADAPTPELLVYPRDAALFPEWVKLEKNLQEHVRTLRLDSPLTQHLLTTPQLQTCAEDSDEPVQHALFCAADFLSQTDARDDQDDPATLFERIREGAARSR